MGNERVQSSTAKPVTHSGIATKKAQSTSTTHPNSIINPQAPQKKLTDAQFNALVANYRQNETQKFRKIIQDDKNKGIVRSAFEKDHGKPGVEYLKINLKKYAEVYGDKKPVKFDKSGKPTKYAPVTFGDVLEHYGIDAKKTNGDIRKSNQFDSGRYTGLLQNYPINDVRAKVTTGWFSSSETPEIKVPKKYVQ